MLSALQELATSKSKKDLELIIVVCWSIWYSRNLFIFEGKRENSQSLVATTIGIVDSYLIIKILVDQIISKHQSINQQAWMPPSSGWYEANVDAAIRHSNWIAGLGVVIRDSKGKFVAVAIQRAIYKGNVAYVEAKAVTLGIQVTKKIKCLPMIIELDSKEVVDLARNRKGCKSEVFWTVVAIQASLKSLNRVQIQHVS